MWEYNAVILNVSPRTAAAFFVLVFTLLVQVHPFYGQETKSRADTGFQELERRLTQQHAATESGDAGAVVNTSQALAALALRQMANLRLLEGSGPKAVELYRMALVLEEAEDARVDLAVALFRTKKNVEARSEVEQVLRAHQKNARAWQLMGSLQMAAEDYSAAVVSLAKALDLQSDVNAQYALAFSLLKVHEKQKAEAVFRQVVELYGDKAIWHVVFGGAYRDTGYPEDAIVEFKRAVAIDPKVGHARFFLGLTYLQENHWAPSAESLEQFNQAIRLEPRNYLVNFYLGALESVLKDFVNSDRHLHVAAEVEPNSPETWLYLGLNAYQQKNLSEAKSYLHKAIDTTGADEERNNYQIRRAYFVLGRIAIAEGAHEEGEKLLARVKDFQQKTLANSADTINTTMHQEGLGTGPGVVPALPQSPVPEAVADIPGAPNSVVDTEESATSVARPLMSDSEMAQLKSREKQLRQIIASSFNDLGTARARQQQYAAALAAFLEAEQWDASTPGLQRNIGAAAFRQNDFAESARALKTVVETKPSDQRAAIMLAMSLFSLEKYSDAAHAFAGASDAAMNDPRAAYAWAYALAHTGQQQQANAIADTMVAHPLPPDVLSLVCHIYIDTENYEHSVTCFKKAYQEDPSAKQAHYEVGASLIQLDRPAEAIPELQQELTLSPNDPEVQYYLAYALLQTSRKVEAAALLQTVIAAKPNHAQAQYQMGKLLLEDGNAEDAIKHLEIAERNDPLTDYIHYQLQLAYRRAGRTADADRETNIYREIKARHRAVDAK